MIALIAYFSLALGVSFLCSLMEAVLLSISHAYIQALIEKGHKSGKLLRELKERINRPLAAILTLNTVAHTVGAAGVGAQVLKLYTARYGAAHAGQLVALVSAVLTLLILVFSEIIPKTLGAVHWKRLGPVVGYGILGLVYGIFPLVVAFEALSRALSPKVGQRRVSREEMMATAEIGKSEGSLHIQESRVIQNMLRLRNVRALDVLTPRSVLLAFQEDQTLAQVIKDYSPIRFSRVPIYGKDLDDVTGIVHRYKLVQAVTKGQGRLRLRALASPIHAVPETASVAQLLDQFIKRREQIFLVVDEYGGTTGIMTLEDAIETLLGVEIVDEFDTVADMRKLALRLWQRRNTKQQPP